MRRFATLVLVKFTHQLIPPQIIDPLIYFNFDRARSRGISLSHVPEQDPSNTCLIAALLDHDFEGLNTQTLPNELRSPFYGANYGALNSSDCDPKA